MRTKKIALNMISDIFPYILIGIVGLVKVNVLIKYIGDVGNGYYQVINQIITYVFLAQLGFSEAVIYSLYKPFAEKNKGDINKIYTGSRIIFRNIGLIILGIIFIVAVCLYFLYGFEDGYRNSAIICFVVISCSYLISYFGKTQTYSAVLSAAQEKYIYSLVFNGLKLLCDILIVLVVIKFRNLESIAIVILIIKIIEEIVMRLVVRKKYKWLKEVADANTSMVKMTKDLAWVQIGYIVLNNTDAIILVAIVGPVAVSIYTTYNFIVRYLNEIASRLELGAVFSFGNVFAKKEYDKAYSLFKEFLSLFVIVGFGMSLTFLLGMRSFVNLWIGNSSYIIGYFSVCLFTLALFLNIIYYPLLALINANGLFKDSKVQIFICACINIILSIILVNFYGLNGLLIGTAISFIVNLGLKLKLIKNKVITNMNIVKISKIYLGMIGLLSLLMVLLYKVEKLILGLNLNFLTCILLLGIIFVLISSLTFGLLYTCNNDTRNLAKRGKLLIKGYKNKLKKCKTSCP